MVRQTMLQLWEQARQIDPTLNVSRSSVSELRRRQLRPVSFSRERLFSRMAKGEPVLFDDLCIPSARCTAAWHPERSFARSRARFPA